MFIGTGRQMRLGGGGGPRHTTPSPPKQVTFDGTAGEYVSSPDSATLDITGDIDIRFHLNNTRPADSQVNLLNKDDVSSNRSFGVELTSSGIMRFRWSTDGTGGGETSSASSVAVAADREYLRVTMDADSGAGQYALTFQDSTDGATWDTVGSVRTGTATSIFAGTAPVEIGRRGNNTRFYDGTIYSATIRDGIDGTLAADYNPSRDIGASDPDVDGETFTSSTTGEVWTIHRA